LAADQLRPAPVGAAARPRVVLVDSDPAARTAIAKALSEAGCEVVAAVRTGIAATYAVRSQRPTVAVIELDLRPAGAWSGLLLIPILVKEGVRVLVVTRPDLAHLAGRVVAVGARRMLPKSDLAGLITAVRAEHAGYLRAVCSLGNAADAGDGRRE
jgi:DNA-binding NarL/FixJ family response regulator